MSTHEQASPNGWRVFHATGRTPAVPPRLPKHPLWRRFCGDPFQPAPLAVSEAELRRLCPGDVTPLPGWDEIDTVNTALLLRRPLLITGPPGVGKSTLAYLISRELGLRRLLEWNIVSRTTLCAGLYVHDAMGAVQALAVWQPGPRRQQARRPGRSTDRGTRRYRFTRQEIANSPRVSGISSPWAPSALPCCPTSALLHPVCFSSTNSTRATSTCRTTCCTSWRTEAIRSAVRQLATRLRQLRARPGGGQLLPTDRPGKVIVTSRKRALGTGHRAAAGDRVRAQGIRAPPEMRPTCAEDADRLAKALDDPNDAIERNCTWKQRTVLACLRTYEAARPTPSARHL